MEGIKCDFTEEWFEKSELGENVYTILLGNLMYTSRKNDVVNSSYSNLNNRVMGVFHASGRIVPDNIIKKLQLVGGNTVFAMLNTAQKDYNEDKYYYLPRTEDIEILHMIAIGESEISTNRGKGRVGNTIPIDIHKEKEFEEFANKLSEKFMEVTEEEPGKSYSESYEEIDDLSNFLPTDDRINKKDNTEELSKLDEEVKEKEKPPNIVARGKGTLLSMRTSKMKDNSWVLSMSINGKQESKVFREEKIDEASQTFREYMNKYNLNIVQGKEKAVEIGIIEDNDEDKRKEDDKSFL